MTVFFFYLGVLTLGDIRWALATWLFRKLPNDMLPDSSENILCSVHYYVC